MTLSVEWHRGRPALARLSGQWDLLASRYAQPFVRSEWLLAWTDAFNDGRDLVLCTVWDGRQLVGGVALLQGPHGWWTAPVNDHTPLFHPVYRDATCLHALIASVVARHPVVLSLRALPDHEPTVAAVLTAARSRGLPTHVQPEHVSPVVDLSAGAPGYRSAVGGRLREYERRRRKMLREHQTQFLLVDRPRDLPQHLEAGLALEAAGWKGRSGTAILCNAATTQFYRDIVTRFDGAGDLALSALWLDDDLVAFDPALIHAGRYHLLKTAYHEGYRSLAPGMVLRLAVIERCLELGLTAHEFLGPDMPWKRVSTDHSRAHSAVRVYSRGPSGVVAYGYRSWLRPRLTDFKRSFVARDTRRHP